MNNKPIEQARDDDLRLSMVALLRAAKRAREIARSTGTFVVIGREGVVEHLRPETMEAEPAVQESAIPYGKKR